MMKPTNDAPATIAPLLHAWLAPMLDEIDYGLMLVEPESHRLLLVNRAARLECAEGRALRLMGEQVVAARAADAVPLAQAVLDAARGRRSLLAIGGNDDDRAGLVTIAVVPLAGAAQAGVLLIVGRRQLCETLSVEMFARRHRLTGAEGQVLRGLCSGLPPARIAERSGVSVSTVRTQIAAIRSKTEAGSIRELVRRVAALPPIVPALRDAALAA